MSDPMTNTHGDIEDVLSSIRRLVADTPSAPDAGRPVSAPGRLVLTPDFRVDGSEGELPEPEVPGDDATAAANASVPRDQDEPSLEERIAELEQAVAATSDEWEPDGSETDDPVVDAMFTPYRRDAFENSDDTATGVQRDDGDDPAILSDQDEILDEEMLRELVSEFVRQELQGALGERITRNVRKLVRAEIQRALAARDFG